MIYTLNVDSTRFEEDFFDAELIKFPGSNNVMLFRPSWDDRRFGLPETLEFIGNLSVVRQIDHLATVPVGYLLISKRMVHTLESVAPFRYELFSTVIYAREIGHLVMDEETGFRTEYQVSDAILRNDNFVILKLRDMVDCLDQDRTIVHGNITLRHSEQKYLACDDGEHFEFYPPQDGFPPVFCVPQLVFYCYTEAAKQACERAGLKGLRFEPLP